MNANVNLHVNKMERNGTEQNGTKQNRTENEHKYEILMNVKVNENVSIDERKLKN